MLTIIAPLATIQMQEQKLDEHCEADYCRNCQGGELLVRLAVNTIVPNRSSVSDGNCAFRKNFFLAFRWWLFKFRALVNSHWVQNLISTTSGRRLNVCLPCSLFLHPGVRLAAFCRPEQMVGCQDRKMNIFLDRI